MIGVWKQGLSMNKIYGEFLAGRAAYGLLLLRVVTGAALMQHGWSKMQAPFIWMNQPGKPPSHIPGWMQAFASVSEFGGGFMLVLGLIVPLAALAIMGTMMGAKVIAHGGMPWINPGGASWELPSLYFVIAAALLLLGPGRFSLDALLYESRYHVPDERLSRFTGKTDPL